VILPATLLAELCGHLDGAVVAQAGGRLAASVSDGLKKRLGAMDGASLQQVIDHVGGELALLGLGSCSAERWGRALVLKVESAELGEATASFLTGFFEGCLQSLAKRPLSVVALPQADGSVRFVVCSEAAANRVRGWRDQGVGFGDAMQRLNSAGESHVS